MDNIDASPSLLRLIADIVSAYLSNNKVSPEFVPILIRQTYRALTEPNQQSQSGSSQEGHLHPAVPPRESVFDDYIVCLEDGKKLRMLKRHLKSEHNLTPDQYKKRWNLPPTYPIVAPAYARKRSVLARDIRLGIGKK